MRIQPILNNRFNFDRTLNNKAIGNNVAFGVGEDYGGIDLDAPENPNKDNPNFKDGLMGVVSMLTFPVSVPIIVAREAYKDRNKDKIETDIDPNNIED